MTTHELAAMLDHLRNAFTFGLHKSATGDLESVAAAFRESPDQKVGEFLKAIRSARAPTVARTPAVDVSGVIDRIRAVRAGTEPAESVTTDFDMLIKPALESILKDFKVKSSGNKGELVSRVRQLLTADAAPLAAPPFVDPAKVTESVEALTRLRDSKDATVAELRSSFEPIRELPKPAVEEIAKQMGYTLSGTKKEVLGRLLSNLEGIKASQSRAEEILNAV